MSFKLWDIGQWVLQILLEKNSDGIHQTEGQLEMANIEIAFEKIFTFENFSTWAGRPWELGHLKKSLYFSTTFQFPLLR